MLEAEYPLRAVQLVGPAGVPVRRAFLWLWKLRKTNGPSFTWPLMMFSGVVPEWIIYTTTRLYKGRPLPIKTRADLLASINRNYWKFLREDTGDTPRPSPDAAGSSRTDSTEEVHIPLLAVR